MPKIEMLITVDLIESLGEPACPKEVKEFAALFPRGARVTLINLRKARKRGLNVEWFANNYFTASAWTEYWRAKEVAFAKYERAKGAAMAEYWQAEASSWTEYVRAKAAAGAEYWRARDAAWIKYCKRSLKERTHA